MESPVSLLLLFSAILFHEIIFVSCVVMDFTANANHYNKTFPKVFLFGDSLTQRGFHNGGWCSMLVEEYERKCDFLNRGFSGYTSRMVKQILPKLLKDSNFPKGCLYAATILLGSNDSVFKHLDDRAVPVDEYVDNLRIIVSEIEKHGVPKERILIISPPPLDEKEWAKFAHRNGFTSSFANDSVVNYADACTKLSKELKIQNLDLWNELSKLENWKELFIDGLHFGKEGHEIVFELVHKQLKPILSPLPLVYPDWKEVNHLHPEKTLQEKS